MQAFNSDGTVNGAPVVLNSQSTDGAMDQGPMQLTPLTDDNVAAVFTDGSAVPASPTPTGVDLHASFFELPAGGPSGTAGNDTLTGDSGDETISAGAGNDTINGGNGVDTIGAVSGVNTLRCQAGNDSITGGSDGDENAGGTGNDTKCAGIGDDDILGQVDIEIV